MPVLAAIVVLAFAAGLLIRRPAVVYAFTGLLAVCANVVFAWTIADGKGNDPGWLILLSLAGSGVAFLAAWGAISLRRRSTSAVREATTR